MERLLIANRGEIAVRVIRTAHALGIDTVAVFSDADRDARHVRMADAAVRLGPAPAAESYLNIERVLDAAARTGADAVHPGYGFLSENAAFAQAVMDAGLTWVGPSPEAIEVMGDKAAAKERMRSAGVPVVPGVEFDAVPEPEQALRAADEVGYPLLVKATFGGGGRGMRRVDSRDGLVAALSLAHAEARASFGRGEVMLERYVGRARHIEIQVFGDTHGAVIHLGERECSIQRRHQKVIEEAPSPAVDDDLRVRMGAAAVAAAKAVDYVGAGTVEFLLGEDGAFYFLEMNTRLQVEHPVTEEVTGLDLVALQLRVATGERIGLTQDDIVLRGHSIEARVYAEDPSAGYLPQTGRCLRWEPPAGEGVRVDHGLVEGASITAWYDPMIAKVIATGSDRPTALRRLRRALTDLTLLGLTHNAGFLAELAADGDVRSGAVHTGWLEARSAPTRAEVDARAVAVAAALGGSAGWRSAGESGAHGRFSSGDTTISWSMRGRESNVRVSVNNGDESRDFSVSVVRRGVGSAVVEVDGVRSIWRIAVDGDVVWLQERGRDALLLTVPRRGLGGSSGAGDGTVRAPMSGTIVSVEVDVGVTVARGDRLLTLEAMKLQSPLEAPCGGVIASIRAAPGETVQSGSVLVEIETPEEA